MTIEAENATGAERRHGRPPPRPVGILIVDPHPCFAQGLKALFDFFNDGTFVVGTAPSLVELAEKSFQHLPEVLVIDAASAGVDEWRVLKTLCSKPAFPRVVVMGGPGEARDIANAFAAGIAAYVHKEIAFDELIYTVRLVSAGHVVASPPVLEALLEANDASRDLTEQERSILRYVAQGFENEEIARLVAVSPSTLKRALHRVVTKLKAQNRIHAAVLASKTGLI